PELALWLAAWKETGKSNGDRLSQLTDFSGNGHHFTQATSANQPRFDTNVLNSQPGFFFDGAAYFVEIAKFLGSTTAELYMVLKTFDTGSSNWGAYKFDGATLASHITFFGTLHTAFGGTNRVNYIPSPSSILTSGFVHQVVVNSGITVYENGNNAKVSGAQPVDWGSGTSPRHLIGASSSNANGSGTSNFYKGHILEVLIYTGARSTAQRNALLADFNSRYGISVTNF
ncbi:MAG TPA: LamG-like jellyroll fold domain-containing protein, partial [Pyrinomonadaceae bacterium]|nr:LamG-like jellyroll fold domain-containing protein [Pyrinomonadaceae bacterium]